MTADPFGVAAAQTALDAALEAREALIVSMVLDDRMTHQTVADAFGLTRARVSQVMARYSARTLAALRPETPRERLARAREEYRLAVHAQTLRAERYALGYAEETAAFYGDESVAAAEQTETRLAWAPFAREYRAQHLETA